MNPARQLSHDRGWRIASTRAPARRVERLARHQAPVEDGAEDGLDGKFGIDAGWEDGTLPSPGGWNRFALEVTDLENVVAPPAGNPLP
jgi:hypothetical protein